MRSISQKKVIGIGLACLDQVISWKSMLKPVKGNTVAAYTMQGGGMAATAMVTVARLGGRSEFWGVVGSDRTAGIIINELNDEGVNTSQVQRLKGLEGPVNIVCVHAPSGERYFFGGKLFSDTAKNPVDLSRLAKAGCLLVDGFNLPSALRAVAVAHKRKIPVVGDISLGRSELRALVPFLDYAVFSEQIAGQIDARGDLKRAGRHIIKMGARNVVFTRGKKGLLAFDGRTWITKKAYPIKAIDTTGAGDTFHGAFCFGIVNGLSLENTLSLASATAA